MIGGGVPGMGVQPGQTAALLEGAQQQVHAGNTAIVSANPWLMDLITAEAARATMHQVCTQTAMGAPA